MCNCNKISDQMLLVPPTIDEDALSYDKLRLPTAHQMIKGAGGVARSICNIGVLPIDVINKRRDTCNTCEFNNKNGIASQCIKCNCLIVLKVKLTRESCPENKW